MTTETQHAHQWTVNHDKGFSECACGEQAAGVPLAKPDALTRLEALVDENMRRTDPAYWRMKDCISEARKEMETKQRVVDTLSGKMGDSVRQGQQQGRVELAQELIENDAELENDAERREHESTVLLPQWAVDALSYEAKE